MGIPVALTFFGSILALVACTSFCYFGDGCYYHRNRLSCLPKLWSFIWFSSAFVGCSYLNEPHVIVYFVSLFAALIGWGIGSVLLDGLWIPAIERIKLQVERRYETANR